ncbi:MAG: hypothetical protein ABIV51_10715 [Saprospiraceae bacterium]
MKWLLPILIFALAQSLHAQVAVEASVDSIPVHIGDAFDLKLSWSYDVEAKATAPIIDSLKAIPDLKILSESKWEAKKFQGTISNVKLIKCIYYNTGVLRIPAFSSAYQYFDTTGIAKSKILEFKISPLAKEGDEIVPIKPIIKEPRDFSDFLIWIYGGLAAVLLSYLIIKRLKKHRLKKSIASLPLDQQAEQQIRKLAETLPWSIEQTTAKYVDLTFWLRQFLTARFEIPAQVETLRQMKKSLSKIKPVPRSLDSILLCMQASDLVKFAKIIPSDEQNSLAINQVLEFIVQNKVIPTAEAKEVKS